RPPRSARSPRGRTASLWSYTPSRICVAHGRGKTRGGFRRDGPARAPCRLHNRRLGGFRKILPIVRQSFWSVGEHIGDRWRRRTTPWAIVRRVCPELAGPSAAPSRVDYRHGCLVAE